MASPDPGAASTPLGTALLVAGLAAVPWVEILVVIPLGIGLGLPPATTFLLAVVGNWVPVALLALASESVRQRLLRGQDPLATRAGRPPSARSARFRHFWERYGLPGAALIAPLVTGSHLATVLAVALGGDPRRVLVWMTLSLLAWGAVITLAAAAGFEGWRLLRG